MSISTDFALTLGEFNFNDAQFGDTLIESDNGNLRQSDWLNVVRANPGNPGALTGPNVDTGIANIGVSEIYTIGYNTPISNGSGFDLGIISARFSDSDTFSLAVSADGVSFTPFLNFGPELAVNTKVQKDYYHGSGGFDVYHPTLFVTPVDLSLFGINNGASIVAVEITAAPEGDLIRVAGLAVPEPATTMLISLGLFALAVLARKRFQRS